MRQKRSGSLAAAGGLAAALLADPAAASELRVVLDGLRSAEGSLAVAVCEAEHFLEEHCALSAHAPAAEGRVILPDVAPGIYAMQAFHDENDSGTLDRNALGWPEEGLGFSRDAPMRFGPPRFEEAALRIGDAPGRMTITIRYP